MRAPAILTRWALIAAHGRLKSPFPGSGGDPPPESQSDDYYHVERFWRDPKHRRFRLLAIEVLGCAQPASCHKWKRPGETRADALARLKWLDLADADEPPVAAMELVIDAFRAWLDDNPPIGKMIPEDESAANAARWHG